MESIHKLETWSEQHQNRWFDVLRMVLGVTLHFKGLPFIYHTADLQRLLEAGFGLKNALLAAQAIAFLHLITGTLIFIGLGTRICSAIMLPVVLAGLFVLGAYGEGNISSDILLTAIVIILLVVAFIYGSGKFSVQYYIDHSRRSRQRITAEPKRA